MFAVSGADRATWLRGLFFGILAAAIAWAIRSSFTSVIQDQSPYIIVVMAAALITTCQGFISGFITILFGGLAANFSFVGRPNRFDFSHHYLAEFVFLLVTSTISLYFIDASAQKHMNHPPILGTKRYSGKGISVSRDFGLNVTNWFIDVSLSLFSALFAPFLYVAARKRWALRATRAVHDAIGITIVRNHYYEPVFTDANLRTASENLRELPGVHFNVSAQMETLDRFRFADELAHLDGSAVNEHIYRYENRMFGEGDADALYSFVRAYKPATVVEIGCGHSSIIIELALRKNLEEQDSQLAQHICLEPFHNQWLEGIGVDFRAQRVEDVDLSVFQNLKRNDIVFVDSSHVLRSNGDVEHVFLRILPILPVGVIIHFHDIFTPLDYSHKFLQQDRRFWTEQYVLEAFLTCNNDFQVLLGLNYMHSVRNEKLYECFPILAQRPSANPGSFWIQRCAKTVLSVLSV